LKAGWSGVITWSAGLFFVGGKNGEGSAFISDGNKISFNLLSLGLGEVVRNSDDSDGSCKRCLIFSLNDDVDDDLDDFTRRGKSTNDSHPVSSRIEESFNLVLGIAGGEVGARCLLEAAGVM